MKRALPLLMLLCALLPVKAQMSFVHDSVQHLCMQQMAHLPHNVSRGATIHRSDTIDILHFIVTMNNFNFGQKSLRGNTQVQFQSKMDGITRIDLDLLDMTIDSVLQNGQHRSYTYADSLTLSISLAQTLQTGDSAAVTVYYQGKTKYDDATFGGFYFQTPYAFNLGVGANFYPHPVGRTWHPCFDNFVERGTYEYYITTAKNSRAYCNGDLIDTVSTPTTNIWHWKINETLPSYLASITVGSYAPLMYNLPGMNGPVPVVIAANPGDTTNAKTHFAKLPQVFNLFEQNYGPYPFSRIGYCMVPSSTIAMEHATNITYPSAVLAAAPFNNPYEYLLIHELAHMWFGDLVTPRTAEDYWLKEGWAVFSEKLAFEKLYGKERYLNEVARTHEKAVRSSHRTDGSYLPVYPVPQNKTYGSTVYDKAADMAHVIRAYMGDYEFFRCIKNYLRDNAYTDQDSYSFRDYLSSCSGVDLTDYFNDWIFSPGWAHFSVDSFTVNSQADMPQADNSSRNIYTTTVHIRQRLDNAPHYYRNVPIEVTFMGSNLEKVTERIYIDGPCSVYKTDLPFNPVFVCTDLDERLSDAITDNYDTLTTAGTINYVYGKMVVQAKTVPSPTFIRVEHNFIAPDTLQTPVPGLHISRERYWRVDGVWPDGFDASASVDYETQGYDDSLLTNSEDSLVMLYRPTVGHDWAIDTSSHVNTEGSASNKIGSFNINQLRRGEYAMAIWQSNKTSVAVSSPAGTDTCFASINTPVGVQPVATAANFAVYPNPTRNQFTLQGELATAAMLEVYSLTGQRLFTQPMAAGAVNQQINTGNWGSGLFILRLTGTGKNEIATKKVVVIKED